ncbi:MAG: TolC family outer membrane protein [Alphaproteobacteria bacterium]|nr:TolC family outer membrane protein [Alphaproteobacteria bacterium]
MRTIAAALLLATISMPAFAQASQETLAVSVASALDNNPELMSQRRTRAVANETLEQARAAMRPSLALSGSYSALNDKPGQSFALPNGNTFPPSGNYNRDTAGLEARQTIYAGGSLAAQRREARAGVNAAEAHLTGYEQQLVLDVATAFVDVRRAEAEVDIRDTNVGELKQQVQAASDRFNVGEVTRTDVAQAEARRAASESSLAAARARLETVRANFERLVGRPPVQLAEPPPAPAIPATLDEAVAIAMKENPSVIAMRANETGAREAVGVARGSLRPNLSVVGNAGLTDTYVDNSYQDTSVGLSARLSIPIYEGGLLASRTRAAKLEADKARFDAMAQERQVTALVTSAWHTVVSARQGIEASEAGVTAAQTALEGAQQELSVGTRITLDVLDQERDLLDARLDLIDARRAEYVAVLQLLAAMGRLTPGVFAR